MNITDKRNREKELVSFMIALYCRKKHGGKSLCLDCAKLNEYAEQRVDHCPFMEEKTFCSNCKVHCYKPPTVAIRHIIESVKEKKRMEKTL